jgi:hypothetical protein
MLPDPDTFRDLASRLRDEMLAFTLERRTNPEEDLAEEKAALFGLFDKLREEGFGVDLSSVGSCAAIHALAAQRLLWGDAPR